MDAVDKLGIPRNRYVKVLAIKLPKVRPSLERGFAEVTREVIQGSPGAAKLIPS